MKKNDAYRKVSLVCLISVTAIMLHSFPALAQSRMAIKFRPGISFPTTDLFDANLSTGLGFEGSISYCFFPHISVYAGWGWTRFSADKSFAGTDMDFEETGYAFGLQFTHPLSDAWNFDYFVKAGLVVNHIEVEDNQGEIVADSGHGPGFQVETGFCIPLGERWNLMPGIKYQTLSRNILIEATHFPVDLNYLSAGVTLSWSF